jgi:cytochrome c oxidase assembly protein subunit 11
MVRIPSQSLAHSKRNSLILLIALVILMLSLSFAAVPLYRIFCQKTGYGGTPKLSAHNPSKIVDRWITVRFNADVHRDLPWNFKPLQLETKVRLGATGLAFYQVENLTHRDITGIATYNVTPDKAAVYFNKIHCFCFEDQTISGHQQVDLPVQFFIDPMLAKDPQLSDVDTITLSYTFFHAKDSNILQILGLPSPKKSQ